MRIVCFKRKEYSKQLGDSTKQLASILVTLASASLAGFLVLWLLIMTMLGLAFFS